MRSLNRGLLCMAGFLLALGFSSVALAQGGSGASAQAISQTVAAESGGPDAVLASAELPDSPGAIQAQSQPQTSTAQQNTSTAPANAGQDQRPQRPEGTAAAEAPKVSGITAAQPSGVAIAPAKQHRTRAIVIKVGAIIAAGAAVGGVVALTKATPSKPPGAH